MILPVNAFLGDTFWQTQPSTTAAIKSIPKLHTMELWPAMELVEPSRNIPKPKPKAWNIPNLTSEEQSWVFLKKRLRQHHTYGTWYKDVYRLIKLCNDCTFPLAKWTASASKCAVQMMPVNRGLGTKYTITTRATPHESLYSGLCAELLLFDIIPFISRQKLAWKFRITLRASVERLLVRLFGLLGLFGYLTTLIMMDWHWTSTWKHFKTFSNRL